jgi:hypothetical protein
MLKAFINICIGFIILLIPMALYTIIVGFFEIDWSFSKSAKWIISDKNPYIFPFFLFYVFYGDWVINFTKNRIEENG